MLPAYYAKFCNAFGINFTSFIIQVYEGACSKQVLIFIFFCEMIITEQLRMIFPENEKHGNAGITHTIQNSLKKNIIIKSD
jgi:hypothetical protein